MLLIYGYSFLMNLLKSLAEVSLMTIFSRLLGFIRDAIIARIFGSGMEIDAFFVAFKLPNLFRRIFAEGAFSQTFIPILTEYKNKRNTKDMRMFISYVLGLLMLLLTIITVLGIIVIPKIITVTSTYFSENDNICISNCILINQLLWITFPYILLISLASFATSILNSWNLFLVSSFSPIFLNITMISFSLFAVSYFTPPVSALAWAVIIGGIFQLAYQLPYLKKIGMLVLPRINFHDIGSIRMIKRMGTAVLGVSVSQISIIINTIFSSFLTSGSVSWLYYADRIIEFPSGVLGVTLGTILLPALSKSFFEGKHEEYCCLMDWGLRLCFLLALPSAVALGILAKPLVVSLFQYGKFTASDALMTQKALVSYSIGLGGLIVVKVLISGFYSRQNIKTPIKVSLITLIVSQLMSLALIGPLKHVGLSLSMSLSSCLNSALLYRQLRKQDIFKPKPGWIQFLLRIFIAVLGMAISLFTVLHFMPDWTFGTVSLRLLRLLIVVTIGIASYFSILIVLGLDIKSLFCYRHHMMEKHNLYYISSDKKR